MESIQHFTHDHLLSLIHLQKNKNNANSDEEEEETEDKDNDDFVVEDQHVGRCNMCKEAIFLFHLCYYRCNDCDYMLHKFCAELPTIEKNHPLHPGHDLTLSQGYQLQESDIQLDITIHSSWLCCSCNNWRKMFYNYHCSICNISMDIICATISQQKMDHPSHPHQLERISKPISSQCNACSHFHTGTFYHCTTCLFMIHLQCALLPPKLWIQRFTDGVFSHSHSLTLAYSFPYDEQKSTLFPGCKVCGRDFFLFIHTWLYKCDRCRYYVHANCATSKEEKFISAGLQKRIKNFTDADHPNLITLPFPDESCTLIKHHFSNHEESFINRSSEKMLNHTSHPHHLIRLDTHSSLQEKSVSLHDPMKRIQLLCDGCVKPVTTLPFYKCSHSCDFVLHEWCARLPSEIQNHPFHPKHVFVLLPNNLTFFQCGVCGLPSNGFMYQCAQCNFLIDVNCAFIPEAITHEGHANHLLSRMDDSVNLAETGSCNACHYFFGKSMGFQCRSCDFYLHAACALLLPSQIIHRFNKHPLTLRYEAVENHLSLYFCEICEEELHPTHYWFYHCTTSAESMHTACVPVKEECEQAVYRRLMFGVYDFINVKFGGTYEIASHPHPVSFIQGTTYHGCCERCSETLKSKMMFKCLTCKFAFHLRCASE